MTHLIKPHASNTLQILSPKNNEKSEQYTIAQTLQKIPLSSREIGDLLMLGMGAFTPLKGFMGHADWRSVCKDMQLSEGTLWPIPITLSIDQEQADSIKISKPYALFDPSRNEIIGTVTAAEVFKPDKEFECQQVYQTTDQQHPGVATCIAHKQYYLAGEVSVFTGGAFKARYPDLYLTPSESRKLFQAKGWHTIAAFQTRNPMHRAHEHLVKTALEFCDGAFIHSLLGTVKPGDIPATIRTKAINTLVDNYFVPDKVVQAGYPLDMRYAGPREAVLHAIFRQNYGCSHIIVGRDHAGVGDYYGAYDAQTLLKSINPSALAVTPLFFDATFWCNVCDGMTSARNCPHDSTVRTSISGTRLREALINNETVPAHISRPEVLQILQHYYQVECTQ